MISDGRAVCPELRFYACSGNVRSLPAADWLIADRGYDAHWFREALKDRGIRPYIPGRKSRGKSVRYDKRRYKRRNRHILALTINESGP